MDHSLFERVLRHFYCYGGQHQELLGFVDEDFIADKDKRISTIGYVFSLASGTVYLSYSMWWFYQLQGQSKRQLNNVKKVSC